MDKNKKILIVTPFPNTGAHQYPHLRYITDFFKLNFECDVFIFEERGLEIHKKFTKLRNNIFNKNSLLLNISLTLLK